MIVNLFWLLLFSDWIFNKIRCRIIAVCLRRLCSSVCWWSVNCVSCEQTVLSSSWGCLLFVLWHTVTAVPNRKRISVCCHNIGSLSSPSSAHILLTVLLVSKYLHILCQRIWLQNHQLLEWLGLVLLRVSRGLVCGHIHNIDGALDVFVAVHWPGLLRPVIHKRPCKFLDRRGRFICVFPCRIGLWCAMEKERQAFSCTHSVPCLFQGKTSRCQILQTLLLLCWRCCSTLSWMGSSRTSLWWGLKT